MSAGVITSQSNRPPKRPCAFAEDRHRRMVRPKPTHQQVDRNVNDLSPQDRQALERAASIFGKPLVDLVQDNWHHVVSTTDVCTMNPLPDVLADFSLQGPSGESEQVLADHLQTPSNAPLDTSPLLDLPPVFFGGNPYEDPVNWADPSNGGTELTFHHSVGMLPTAVRDELQHTWAEVPCPNPNPPEAGDAELTNSRDITIQFSQQTDMPTALDSVTLRDQGLYSVSDFSAESCDDGSLLGDEEPLSASAAAQDPTSLNLLGSSLSSTASEWLILDRVQTENNSREVPPINTTGQDSFQWISCDPRGSLSSHRRQRRGPFQNQRLREETGNTRKLKACVRCRMQKIRCVINDSDPSGVCRTCQAVSKQKIYTIPCVRYKITECTLYRTGKAPGLEFTFRWPVMKLKDISKWASTEVRNIQIQSDVSPVPLQLSVKKFVPMPRDSLHRSWMDGKIKKFKETTPYAIANMGAAAEEMNHYINANVFKSMGFFLKGRDELIVKTYSFAQQYLRRAPSEDERNLMANFFRLWFAIRRTATVEHIIGDDKLDMSPELADQSYPLFEKVPLTPVMIQQLDMILTLKTLIPLRKKVLEDFQKLVLSNKPRSWLTMYLITFMFLHSCAALSVENYHNARQQGLRRRYAIPTFIWELHHGANVFLSHYHYSTQPCNPFHLNWKRRQATPFAELTTEEVHFLIQTGEMVKDRAEKIRRTNDNGLYEDDLYFVAQMFEKDWTPRDTEIDFDNRTVSDVPLRKFYGDKDTK